MAANEMAKDPRNATSDFIPLEKKRLILHATPMIGPTRSAQVAVLRFEAPTEPGIYPYVCTFPGHWVVMKGDMVVARDLVDVPKILAARKPTIIRAWKMADFAGFKTRHDAGTEVRGMQAFLKANCHQCHALAGHGINLGPDLCDVGKRFRGEKLLRQILEPSVEINDKFRNQTLILNDGRIVTGVIQKEEKGEYHVLINLLTPHSVTRIRKRDVENVVPSKLSPMPPGLLDVLTGEEIEDLVSFLEAGYVPPGHPREEEDRRPGRKKGSER